MQSNFQDFTNIFALKTVLYIDTAVTTSVEGFLRFYVETRIFLRNFGAILVEGKEDRAGVPDYELAI